jgi:hypothetical protein
MTRRPAPPGPAAPSGLPVMRALSACCGANAINACRSLGARFSVTVRKNASARKAITRIGDNAWTLIKHPKTPWGTRTRAEARPPEIAEVPCTAFSAKPKNQQVTTRLIGRRVTCLGSAAIPAGQGMLFESNHRYCL